MDQNHFINFSSKGFHYLPYGDKSTTNSLSSEITERKIRKKIYHELKWLAQKMGGEEARIMRLAANIVLNPQLFFEDKDGQE